MLLPSLLAVSTLLAAAPEHAPGCGRFVLYYGWYSDPQGEPGPDVGRILAAAPQFVVSPARTSSGQINLRPAVIQAFHDGGVEVIAYVATAGGARALSEVLQEIDAALAAGADGVFLDEVGLLRSDPELDYYRAIYTHAKAIRPQGRVVANPGSILVHERIMTVCDILSFEHQWRLAPEVGWVRSYPPWRFLGISSNDIDDVMGYEVDAITGVRDTAEAWQTGIGYHFSTDTYTALPPWFETYERTVSRLQRRCVRRAGPLPAF